MRNDKGISQLKARDKTKVRAVDKLPEGDRCTRQTAYICGSVFAAPAGNLSACSEPPVAEL
jgi:hypothetical protein